MWKKWMAIVFISVFVFTMAACGSSGRTNDRSAGQGTEQTESDAFGLKYGSEMRITTQLCHTPMFWTILS